MRRSGWTFVVFVLVALIVAAALAYNYTQRTAPPLPSEQVEERSKQAGGEQIRGEAPKGPGAAAPMPTNPSAQNEIDCVDRLLRNGAPAGSDQKAEWDRCAAMGEAAIAAEARREQDAREAAQAGGNAADERR